MLNAARFAFALTLACTALTACTAADNDEPAQPGSAQSELKGSYGYEFFADKLGTAPADAAPKPAEVQGRLAPELVRDVLRTSHGALQACERQARGHGDATAEVRLQVAIGADGNVLRIQTGDAPRPLAACFQSAIQSLRFPRSGDGTVDVVYPVLLGTGS